MYHRFVAGKVRGAFAQISAGNWQAMIDAMAPEFTYRFYGEHALSGERHTKATLALWWQRNFRLMPDPHFEVRDIVVAGPPWRTRVATLVEVSATVAGEVPYRNVFMQMMKMSWGRITDIRTLEDTVVLQRALNSAAQHGSAEALADPITDEHAAAAT
ncbi:nuclear transport factor 2 family protein [Frankia tisae]|uniref:nuclear transport factor 2 family protein n=1 Tax=Frankia tisae TaxID=2950104 RepID=UPI0021C0B688|nr:nuclear transport factor 2 family protein [Frankia tisae]